MVSVCMATRNGERYIREQLDSILSQLGESDEIVISDDGSEDDTVRIIQSYNDNRISIIQNSRPVGVSQNFERALFKCRGKYVFLADQDDVWVSDKLETTLKHLQSSFLVVSDCLVVDQSLRLKNKSFFSINNSGSGLIRNILKNSYIGCCMAFRRELLQRALPFPNDIPMHDFWIGMIAELHYDVKFIADKLVYHRRHNSNASSTGRKSALNLLRKINFRYRIIKNLMLHKSYAG
jgi:glycosyltransferase involved in cell wall biosynthesis